MAGHMREGDGASHGSGLLLAAVAFLAVALAALWLAVGHASSGQAVGSSDTGSSQGAHGLEPKAASDYDWSELSQVSALVADAASDEDGIAVARSYGLVDDDGVPVEAPIDVALSDGTLARAQLVGVRHDTRPDGTACGLTYMLSVVADEPMERADTTEGGWESSELRAWASSDGKALLPAELASRLVAVAKSTNNVGVTDDAAAVTQTVDELWAFSASEVCGAVSWFRDEYGPTMASYDDLIGLEGEQYPYFRAAGVTGGSDPSGALALTYRGASWAWWYRTPYPYVFMGRGDSGSFFQVTASGFPSSVGLASSSSGVVLGFCI